MIIDNYFTQGTTHRVCQDYALSTYNKQGDEALLVVCDGCSSAEIQVGAQKVNNTDIGVRLLARAAAKHAFQANTDGDGMFQRIVTTANGFRSALSLERECLYSTLMMVVATYGGAEIWCVGDGMVAVRNRRTKAIDLYEISFPNGAPWYLQYEYEDGCREAYLQNCGAADYEVHHYRLGTDGVEQPQVPVRQRIPLGTDRAFRTEYLTFSMKVDWNDCDLVVLMSDGISNFLRPVTNGTSSYPEKVPAWEVAKELLAFKGFQGEFVQRRCVKGMKTLRDMGWQNTDDLSVAAVHMPDKQPPLAT